MTTYSFGMSGQRLTTARARRRSSHRSVSGFICGLAALLGGCHSSARETIVPLEGLLGVYHFSERIPAAPGDPPIIFEGDFTVIADTVKVDADPGPCRYDKRTSASTGIMYQCGIVSVVFDRKNPISRSTYSVALKVPTKQQPQCSATVRRNCTTSTDAASDHTEIRHGTITAVAVR
jgi:hypothetical protein